MQFFAYSQLLVNSQEFFASKAAEPSEWVTIIYLVGNSK